MMQYRPSSAYNSPFWTTNSGAPVWNNNSSLTVGSRGINFVSLFFSVVVVVVLNYELVNVLIFKSYICVLKLGNFSYD